MNLSRLALGGLALSGLIVLAIVGQDTTPTATKMSEAANDFLNSLTAEQKARVTFAFDDPHRTQWFFTPQQDKDKKPTRKGLRLEELDDKQKAKFLALLKTGTSQTGYEQASTIMSLEAILRDTEKKGVNVRNPEWYFVSIFGKPDKTGSWGWRIEGHHMAISYTIKNGVIDSPTPFFFGANPANVLDGDRKGLRTLPEIEDIARDLIKSFKPEINKMALQEKHFAEVGEKTERANVNAPVGVPYEQMSDESKQLLLKLVTAYAKRMPNDVAEAELKRVKEGDYNKIYFAYSGSPQPGRAWTYRVHGPTFVVEFLNVQPDGSGNPNNHIHSSWRRLPVDFGLAK